MIQEHYFPRLINVPIVAYILYSLTFIIGYYVGLPSLNIVGALLFIFIVIIGNYKHLLARSNDTTIGIALLIITVPVVWSIANNDSPDFGYIVKHIMTYLTYFILFSYNVPPLYTASTKKYLFLNIIILILVSVVSGNFFVYGDEVRLSGVFTNPNNLALMALSSVFFIDEDCDSICLKWFVYLTIVIVLILASTSGAILAFSIGIAYKHRKYLFKGHPLKVITVAAVICLYIAFQMSGVLTTNRLFSQADVIIQNLDLLQQLDEIDYGLLMSEHNQSSLSGLWRISHWSKAMLLYFDGSFRNILFGYGIGSSMSFLGNVPHNEYIRVLFEQGVVGLTMFISFYLFIFSRIPHKYHYVLLIFAIYGITENIIENMLFMTIFMVYLATLQVSKGSASYG